MMDNIKISSKMFTIIYNSLSRGPDAREPQASR